MNNIKNIFLTCLIFLTTSCVSTQTSYKKYETEKQYYSSAGFALIYEDSLYMDKTLNKKINNDNIEVLHSFLKKNTPIKIINPENHKFIETKIKTRASYPPFFKLVISKKIAEILEINVEDPLVEVLEIKKNKTFVAKESITHDEEKNVTQKVPVKKIEMDNLNENSSENKIIKKKKNLNYFVVVSDFYYLNSAENLIKEIKDQISKDVFFIKKINDNKYRLSAGPFKNFNALKPVYIGLNNLGFEDLNIYKE